MNWRVLLRAPLLALAVLLLSLSLAMVAAPVHRSLFAVVPPDGPITEEARRGVDRSLVRYLTTGDQAYVAVLTDEEQVHMADVRRLWQFGLLVLAVAAGVLALTRRQPGEAAWAVGLLSVSSIASLIWFEPFFLAFHEVAFLSGNWYLPAETHVLTQAYPALFFALAWAAVVASSLSLLGVAWAVERRQRERR